jgi:hypothetical protein
MYKGLRGSRDVESHPARAKSKMLLVESHSQKVACRDVPIKSICHSELQSPDFLPLLRTYAYRHGKQRYMDRRGPYVNRIFLRQARIIGYRRASAS